MKLVRSFFAGALVSLYFFVPAASAFAQFTLPPTCTLSASAQSVPVGNTVNLTWTSYNASGGTITNVGSVGISGTQGVIPTGPSTTYTGTFTGPGGSGQCSITVTVTGGTGTVLSPPSTGGITPAPNFTCPSGYTYQSTTGVNGTIGSCVPLPSSPSEPTSQYDCGPGQTFQSVMGPNGAVTSCVAIPATSQTSNTQSSNSGTASGSGLVPCGVSSNPITATECSLCNFVQLIQNVINFLVGVSIPISVGLFAWAGVLYFTSTGNPTQIDKAHKIFKSVLIGFAIVLAGWMVIQTLLNVMVNKAFFTNGNVFDLQCTSTDQSRDRTEPISKLFTGQAANTQNTNPTNQNSVVPTQTSSAAGQGTLYQQCMASGGDSTSCDPYLITIDTAGAGGQSNSSVAVVLSPTRTDTDLSTVYQNVSTAYASQIAGACSQPGISIPDCATVAASLITVESSGKSSSGDASSGAGLMQVSQSAANYAGVSCDVTQSSSCNINAGVAYLNKLYQSTNDLPNAIAGYNSGGSSTPGQSASGKNSALVPSVDCSGDLAWQCGINPGGLVTTQGEVANVCETMKLANSTCSQ